MKLKLLLSAVFMAVAISAAVFLSLVAPFMAEGAAEKVGGERESAIVLPGSIEVKYVLFLTPLEICNPEIATKYGVKGYLEIKFDREKYTGKVSEIDEASRLLIGVKRGGETRIPLILRFVSYFENITEIEVVLDSAPMLWMGRKSGSAIGVTLPNGTVIFINKYVRYEPSGIIKVKHNQPVEVVMIVSIPEDFPLTKFPLGAVGIAIKDPLAQNPLSYFIIDMVALEAVTI
ncbi:MAG: hypothetical protein QW702_08435 [Candidatus Bathyarchaeia archaeon]